MLAIGETLNAQFLAIGGANSCARGRARGVHGARQDDAPLVRAGVDSLDRAECWPCANTACSIVVISGGSGFCAQNQRRLHFGLGKNPRLEKAEIRWPSGKTQTIDQLMLGETNKIKEPA